MWSVTHSNAFGTLFEYVWRHVRTSLASHLNAFGFSFELVWLFIQTCFGFSFKCVWLFVWMCFIQRLNASRLWNECIHTLSERTWTKNVLYLVPDGYCIWCSSIDKLDNFELFINRQHYFFCLNFSTILCTLLKFYSIDSVTTTHVQSSQDCVQIIKGSYNQVSR